MTYEMKRNPGFTPSPIFRKWLNKKINARGDNGVTNTLNDWFDRYRFMIGQDAIKLTDDELYILKEMLQGVFIDVIAIQAITEDIADCPQYQAGDQAALSLAEKFADVTFGQVLATLEKYELI